MTITDYFDGDADDSHDIHFVPEIMDDGELICALCGNPLQLVGSGYTRTYYRVELVDGVLKAWEDYPASFSDEGDGNEWLECRSCLARHEYPNYDDVEYN